MNISEAIYGVIFSPSKTLKEISQEKIWLSGLLIFFIVMTFNLIINLNVAGLDAVGDIIPVKLNFVWIFGFIGIIFSIIMLFVVAGFYALLADVFYQSTNPSGLLAAYSFASIPAIFGPPLQYLATTIGLNFLSSLLALAIGIWVIILQVIAIRESHDLSTSQAIILFIIPLITSIVIVGIILATVFSTFPLYK